MQNNKLHDTFGTAGKQCQESVTTNLNNVCNIFTKYDLQHVLRKLNIPNQKNTKLYSCTAHFYITLNKCIVHITKLNTAYSAREVTLKS